MTDNTFLKKLSRTFFAGLVACLFIGAATNAAHAACATNEIDVLGDGTQCETSKFEVTTTNLSANDTIKFTMSAKGTFYVDCGTDGTLSGSGVSGKQISRGTSTTNFTCTYSSSGVKTIRFGGLATAYPITYYNANAAISFYNSSGGTQDKIAGISGSLGAIFPTIGDGSTSGLQPNFFRTFSGCINLTGSIPSGLFSGISGAPAKFMFYATFEGCSGLTGSIPSGLFSGISGTPALSMFGYTFYGCSGLTGSIPSGLFSGISGAPAERMFEGTFQNCTGLSGQIPATLFNGISGAPAPYMFYITFNGCSGLTGSIPSGLFSGISGTPAEAMFASTFNGCSGLTGSIPSGLFSGVSGTPAPSMFYETFYGCSGLTGSIPEDLFAGISGASGNMMFYRTFRDCTNLTGPVPKNLFAGIPTYTPSGLDMYDVFNGTNLWTSCPVNYEQYFTGFENYFSGKVSCECSTGYYGNGVTCTACTNKPSNSSYSGGATSNTCPYECNSGYYMSNDACTSCATLGDGSYTNSNAGSTSATQCYKACTTAVVSHSAAVTGNDYYGAGTDTCSATSCENGWHINGGTPPDLNTIIGTVSGGYENNDKYGYISNDGSDTYKDTTYGLTENGTFALEYANNKGTIRGRAQCSSRGVENIWYNNNNTFSNDHFVSTLPDSTGQYCYCTVDEYTPVDGAPMSLSAPWVVDDDLGSASDCATRCAFECSSTALGNTTSYPLAFRAAIFGSLTGGVATCEITDITVGPGYYLPAGTETPVQCTAGNFCPGLPNPVHYDADNNQGITACSTVGDHSYTNSAVGAGANTACYRTCTSTDVAHSATVRGTNYYGAASNTCSAATCTNGYHTYVEQEGFDLETEIGDTSGWLWYIRNDGTDWSDGDAAAHGLTQNGTFTVWYFGVNDDPDDPNFENPTGIRITGRSQCSTRNGAGYDNTWIEDNDGYWVYQNLAANITDTLPNNSGVNCYCTLDSYTPVGGASQSISTPWVFLWDYNWEGGEDECAQYCVSDCGDVLSDGEYYNMGFREAMFGSLPSSDILWCTGNTITVNWSDASAADIAANTAGTVTYGGDIRTPRAATIIPGKVFLGWKFSRPGA